MELSPLFKQVVSEPTWLNPPAILDKIITTLHTHYQVPEIQPPLDSDPDKTGKPSDHNIVVAEPISEINNNCAREKRKVIVRRMPDNKLEVLKDFFKCEDWQKMKDLENTHEQAQYLHSLLVNKFNEIIPEKSRTISSDDQPWYTEKLKHMNKEKKNRISQKSKVSEMDETKSEI